MSRHYDPYYDDAIAPALLSWMVVIVGIVVTFVFGDDDEESTAAFRHVVVSEVEELPRDRYSSVRKWRVTLVGGQEEILGYSSNRTEPPVKAGYRYRVTDEDGAIYDWREQGKADEAVERYQAALREFQAAGGEVGQ